DEILNNHLTEHFPLVVWQTGSGTQSNMHVNEVIAHVGNEWLKNKGSEWTLHPNDDVNKSQGSNDTYQTALHIAPVLKLEDHVLPAIEVLKDTIKTSIAGNTRSEEHTSELQSRFDLVCRLLLEKKKGIDPSTSTRWRRGLCRKRASSS